MIGMREAVFEDRYSNGKISRVYAGTRILCDRCKKVLSDYTGKAIIPFFSVCTHFRSNGMEVLDSYKKYDYCSEECLMSRIRIYLGEVSEFSNEREIHIHHTGDIR